MSTICKLAIPAHSVPALESFESVLRERNVSFERTDTEWPLVIARDTFIASDRFPSIFSIKQVTPEVTEIHFNSFSKLNDLASRLSAMVGVHVVVNIYQSVSTASYWALHSAGKQLRTIEASDGVVEFQTGTRLPFEGTEPGRGSADAAGEFNFDSTEQDWYNREVGIPVDVYQNCEAGWINLILRPDRQQRSEASAHGKSWWHFW